MPCAPFSRVLTLCGPSDLASSAQTPVGIFIHAARAGGKLRLSTRRRPSLGLLLGALLAAALVLRSLPRPRQLLRVGAGRVEPALHDQHVLSRAKWRQRCQPPRLQAVGGWRPGVEPVQRQALFDAVALEGEWLGEWNSTRLGVANEWCPAASGAGGRAVASSPLLHFGHAQIRRCLEGRWVLFVGDSSVRIFFGALVSMVPP